jgi:TonB-linked SusC/RagA family outer membrane protein
MENKIINFKLKCTSKAYIKNFLAHRISGFVLLIGLFIANINFALSQNLRVSGTTTDASTGEPLVGVSIVIEGTTQGTISDIQGSFIFESLDPNATLVFSSIGYLTEKVVVTGQSSINVSMIPDITKLEEIVVIGYSSTQRKNIASAVAVVNNKDLANFATSDLNQALQGKIAGVQVVNNNGDPGSGAKIIVRGIGSFTNSDPLYVIDGIAGGDINSVSPYDIQSVTVLKDAATTAIYGSAAANGIVLITTKSGTRGKMKVSYEGSYGAAMVSKKMEMLNASQYIDLVSDIQTNNRKTLTDTLNNPDYSRVDRTDWQDAIFRTAPVMEHNLRFSGGDEDVTYAFSAGYLNQKSILIDQQLERFHFGTKLTENLFKNRVRFGQNLRIKNDIKEGQTCNFYDALRMPPYLNIYDEDVLGGYSRTEKTIDLNDANNPFAIVYLSPKTEKSLGAELELTGEVELIKGLMFKSQARLSAGNSHSQTFNYPVDQGNFDRDTSNMSESYSYHYNLILENFFTYDRTFDIHNISLTAGNTYNPSGYYRSLSVAGSGFSSDDIQSVGLAKSKTITGFSVNSGSARLSYFGRAAYTLNEKYVINTTLRRDGSSVFGIKNRWGNFYGVGGAWIVSGESFMNQVSAINNLKLRVSYGKTGNDNILPFLTTSTIWSGESRNIVYSFGDNDGTYAYGATVNSMANPFLKWEETVQTDIGFDLALYKKLNIVFDYFKRDNKDLLISASLPPSTGLGTSGETPSQMINAASMKNKGCELSITYNGNLNNFKWDVNANITYSTNEVYSLGTVEETPMIEGYLDGSRTDIGHPIASFWGYKVDHVAIDQAEVDQLNANLPSDTLTEYQSGLTPGDFIFQDVNKDGHIDDDDRTYIGNPAPKWQYGLVINGEYKAFDFQVMVQGLAGVEVVNASRFWFEGMTRPFNSYAAVLDRWREPGDISPLPAAGQHPENNAGVFSDWYVEKGDYMRVKNITLGYTLDQSILKYTKLRVYLALQNILTITKYSGYDPEISALNDDYIFQRGIDDAQHPNPKIYRIGLQLNF